MKNPTKTILAILATGLLSCMLVTPQAQAITGDIAFFGAASASGASGAGTTTIHFTNPWHVIAGSGDYAVVPFNTPATFADFSFTGDGLAATLTAPKTPLWSFVLGTDTYSFDLLALTSGHTESGGMAFTGTGTAHINGDSSSATWALSGTAKTGFKFSFSTSTTSTGVPDGGGALALLGIALSGIEVLRRKLKAS
jgi:hypothetical protein